MHRIRRGSRIQKGGGFVHSEGGGGGFVQEFQERIQIVAGFWPNQQAKKIADSRVCVCVCVGGFDHPKKTCIRACCNVFNMRFPGGGGGHAPRTHYYSFAASVLAMLTEFLFSRLVTLVFMHV